MRDDKKFQLNFKQPNWYRELSEQQMDAVDDLLQSIYEDETAGTVFRVQRCLLKLGICPLIESYDIHSLILLSRRSDIAFLWFLDEMYYTNTRISCPQKSYTLNEQLLLSAICHLDMITILRELDKLLPKSDKSITSPCMTTKLNKLSNVNKDLTISPYLQPLPRPEIWKYQHKTPIYCYKGNFKRYKNYLDVNYIVKNEKCRWFAEKLSFKDIPDKGKLVLEILDDILKQIFSRRRVKPDCCKDKKVIISEEIIKDLQKTICEVQEKNQRINENHKFQIMIRKILHQIIDDATSFHGQDPINDEANTKEQYFVYDVSNISAPSEEYFQRPKGCCPFKFNWERIYRCDELEPDNIEKAIRNILDISKHTPIEQGVIDYIEKIWNNEKLSNVDFFDEKCGNSEMSAVIKPIFYNPRNDKQIENLLEDAFLTLRKNPKFVLPFLPNAHKLPTLKIWMRIRFGFSPTDEEREEAVKISSDLCNKIMFNNWNVKMPKMSDISSRREISYACKNKLVKKVKRIVGDKTTAMKHSLLAKVRKIWVPMERYRCNTEGLKRTYFAYLPAHEYNITPFRPWKFFEFRDVRKKNHNCSK